VRQQLQPNKPQKTTQTKNKTQNTTIQPTCAHKTPTTTNKQKTQKVRRIKTQPAKTLQKPIKNSNLKQSLEFLQDNC